MKIIRDDRRSSSSKELKGNNETDGNVFLLDNVDKKDQAFNMVKTIQHLYDTQKVKNYRDIAILSRSIKDSFTKEIIATLDENKIPYEIRGNQDLLEKDEIKSILTLFYYLVQDDDSPHIINSWEKDWLNLDAYGSKSFNSLKFFNLSEETREIFTKKEEEYREDLLIVAKEVQKEFTGSSRVRSFNGVFNLDDDLKIEIFKRIQKPLISFMNTEDLKAMGIKNENDLNFFNKLYDLKQLIISNTIFKDDSKEEVSKKLDNERITLLDIFYKLLEIIGYYNQENVLDDSNYNEIANLAIITTSIENYENIIQQRGSKFSVMGLFWFLYHRIRVYSATRLDEEDGVQILTVHTSKGLEFPVTIVSSIKQDKFPSKYRDEEGKLIGAFGIPYFATPDELLEYRKVMTKEEKERFHELEERRVLYVAMSRAEDILILSTVEGIPEIDNIDFDNIQRLNNIIDENGDIKNNNFDTLPFTRSIEREEKEEETLNLSYTSIRNYENCPFKYNLLYNFNFKVSHDKQIQRGIEVHDILDKIHKTVMENSDLRNDDDFIKNIANQFLKDFHENEEQNDDINENVLLKQFEDIEYYWNNFGKNLEIIGSEVPFSLVTKDYNLSGIIDLIYKTGEGKIGMLDFKNQIAVDISEVSKQLFVYLLAIKQNPDFSDYEVDELVVYPLKGRKWINIDLNPEEILKVEEEINNTVIAIKNKEYSPNESKECKECEFAFICENE